MCAFPKLFGRSLLCSLVIGVATFTLERVALAQDETPAAEEESTEGEATEEGEAPATQEAALTDEELNQLSSDGEKALASGDFESALTIYEKLIRAIAVRLSQTTDPAQYRFLNSLAQPAVLTGRGQALAGVKEYKAALADFDQALEINESYIPALLARGQMYLDLGAGGAASALPDFEQAVTLDRTNMKAQFGLGKSRVLGGDPQGAIRPLTLVLAAEPQSAEAFRLRGSAYAGIGDSIKAKADLQEALQLNPKDFEAYFTLGTVLMRDEDYQEAVPQFSQSIENYVPPPGLEGQPFVQGYLTKAMALIELGKAAKEEPAKKEAYQSAADECELLLKQLDEENPNTASARAATHFGLGVAQRMHGDLEEAIASLSKAIEIDPEMGEAIFRRGICFHLIGEDKMAISDFKHAANIMFEDPRASLWEGFLFSKTGDYHEAVRAFGNALAASDRYTPAYVNRGLAYMMLGQYQKAVHDFNEAIRLEPTRASHYFKRGVAYAELGDHERASSSFASAIQYDDSHSPSYRRMADTMERLGHADLAREYRQKAQSLAPQEAPRQPQ